MTVANEDGKGESEFAGATHCDGTMQRKMFLQIVPMILHGEGGVTLNTYGILDSCSMSTLIREEVADKLKLRQKCIKNVNLGTINETRAIATPEVSLHVSNKDGSRKFKVESAYVRPSHRFNMPARPSFTDRIDAFKHLEGIEFHAVEPKDISILIGANVPRAVVTTNERFGSKNQPLAVETPFGWTLFGPSLAKNNPSPAISETINVALQSLWEDTEKPPTEYVNLTMEGPDAVLHQAVERFWKEDHVGILPEKEVAMSREDSEAMNKLETETRLLQNGKYEAPMLWHSDDGSLPDDRAMALKRYFHLEKRLLGDMPMFHGMNKVIQGYLQEKPPHARKLTAEEAKQTPPRTWYLPIHPVVNPNKPGKVRVVNDAAAVYQGQSLNSNLRSGPDLLSSLVGVLLRFRNGAVAFAADVEAMFHQVRVSEKDADSH